MTLWLSRLMPDPASRQARRDLSGSGTDLHHRVMALFPDGLSPQPRAHLGLLFRTDETPRGPVLLLQSNQRPTLDRLPTDYATLHSHPLDDLLDALAPGRAVHYRCVASPVRKPGAETRALYNLPPVVPLHGEAADQWWQRQAANAGLITTAIRSQPLDAIRGPHPKSRNTKHANGPISHHRTRFDGTATITDVGLLRQAITHGIGRGKAYGCGLLSIAPARRES
ncbi:type I-E CRISPR-associated protein Cas6/Cse3/CasE [Streptomyces sp. NPDC047014]|uniref:type I-E CRISPR-associated protein Cas6/Cse3/CasE n=1 Tax=Streptomyces sp. NPDC047014 TaxID=3155736 RepID=UPI00340F028E